MNKEAIEELRNNLEESYWYAKDETKTFEGLVSKAESFDAGIEHIDVILGYLSEDLEVEEDSHIRSLILNEMAALKLVNKMMTESGDSE